MEIEQVKQLIEAGLPGALVEPDGDGCQMGVVVTYAGFAGKTLIQQHRMVMETVKAQVASEELHALSIKTKAE